MYDDVLGHLAISHLGIYQRDYYVLSECYKRGQLHIHLYLYTHSYMYDDVLGHLAISHLGIYRRDYYVLSECYKRGPIYTLKYIYRRRHAKYIHTQTFLRTLFQS